MPYRIIHELSPTVPAFDLMTQSEAALSSAGWLLEDTVNPVAGATMRVWRSPARLNSIGRDFFLSLLRSSDTVSVMSAQVFEGYNRTTREITKPAMDRRTGRTVDVDGSVVGTFSLYQATGVRSFSVDPFFYPSGVVNNGLPSSVTISATADRLVVLPFSADSRLYAGLYETVLPAAHDPVPLMVGAAGDSTNTRTQIYAASYTREPMAAQQITTVTDDVFWNGHQWPDRTGKDSYLGTPKAQGYYRQTYPVRFVAGGRYDLRARRGYQIGVYYLNFAPRGVADRVTVTDTLNRTRTLFAGQGLAWVDGGL